MIPSAPVRSARRPINRSRRRVKGQAGELRDQPAIVAVDGQAGEAVSLAEDEAVGRGVSAQAKNLGSQPYRLGERSRPEGFVERAFVPAIQPDADRARGIKQPTGDELPLARS